MTAVMHQSLALQAAFALTRLTMSSAPLMKTALSVNLLEVKLRASSAAASNAATNFYWKEQAQLGQSKSNVSQMMTPMLLTAVRK